MSKDSTVYNRRGAPSDLERLLATDVPAELALDRVVAAHAIGSSREMVANDLGDVLDAAFSELIDLDDYTAALDADIRPEDLSEHPEIPQAFRDLDNDAGLACVSFALSIQCV